MGVCQNAFKTGADRAFDDLHGVAVQHDLHLTLRDLTEWSAIAAHLPEIGAELRSLSLTPLGASVHARCRLAGISEGEARALVAAWLNDGSIQAGGVEHVLVREVAL